MVNEHWTRIEGERQAREALVEEERMRIRLDRLAQRSLTETLTGRERVELDRLARGLEGIDGELFLLRRRHNP